MFRLSNLFKSRSHSPKAEQTRRCALEPLEERQLLSVTLCDATANVALAHQDTVYLTSYQADASGQAYDPAYGETVFRRLTFKNTGDDPIEISSAALSSGSRVELVGEFSQNLEPNEETSFLLKWQALATESSTFTIQTDDPDQPTFQIALSGAVRANTTQYAQIEDVGLLVDTGVSATDSITCNPTITGEVAGALYGGRVDVEFDFDADSVVDALESVYVVGAFAFDPSEYSSAYAAPESGTSPVSLRYRPAIYDAYGTLLQTGSWQTFSFTLEPAPSSSITVSNLAVSANYDGDWTRPDAAKLTGSMTGSGARVLEIQIDGERYRYPVDSSTFTASLPVGFEYGESTTMRARGGQYDATTGRVLYGAWSTLTVTPAPCAVASLALKTDDGVSAYDNISSDVTLVGTLANGVGRNYSEVEFSCGNEILGSAYTDENGEFTFTPYGLPIVNGVATGTVVARAVYRPEVGQPVYGTSQSITITYAPSSSSDYYSLTLALADPVSGSSSTTETPTVNISGSLPKDLDVNFEYRWKLANDSSWSQSQIAYGTLDDALNTDENAVNLYWNAAATIPALYQIATSPANVSFQARPVVYDEILGTYNPTGTWSSLFFAFQKPTPDVPTVSMLALANPTDGLGQTTSDPTISGQIASGGEISGVALNFYSGATLIGSTTADASGNFTFKPSNLATGTQTITCRAKVWDATTRQYVEGTGTSVSFTLVAPTVFAPTFGELRLWDDTGVANDGITANATIYGQIAPLASGDSDAVAYLLVEYDLNGDGTADGRARSDASGEFCFTPQLTPGAHTVGVRASRWDVVNQTEVVGSWTNVSVTVTAPTTTLATLAEFAPEDAFLDASNQLVGYVSTVAGRVSSETDYADLTVEYEITSGGVPGATTHSGGVDGFGRFCWTPELAYSTTDTNVSIRCRVGRYDAITQTTTWSGWTTTSFIYRSTTESEIQTITSTVSSRDGAEDFERQFSGHILPGVGIRSYVVEYDVDNDETPEGRVAPNSLDDVLFYAVPKNQTFRVRVVDKLLNDTERVSSQGWVSVSNLSYALRTLATELNLYFEDAVDYVPYLQVENYQGSYSSLTISLDYDHDGKEDATLSPNNQGRVYSSQIITALTNNGVDILPGFSVVFAHISFPEANVTERVPFPLYLGDSQTERDKYDEFTQLFISLVDYDPTDVPGAANANQTPELVYQITDEPTSSTSEYAALTTGAQFDHDLLEKIPIPEIPRPNLSGETVDLSKDVALLAQLDAIQRNYENAVAAAQDAWQTTCDDLLNDYNAATDQAWNDYSTEYARISQEFDRVSATTWEDSDEYAAISARCQNEINQLTANKTAKLAEISSRYTTERQAIKATYDATALSVHASPDCSNWNHSQACQLQQINAEETFYNAALSLSINTLAEQLSVDVEFQKEVLKAEARRDSALADGEEAFSAQKEQTLASLASESARLGRDYQFALTDALQTLYSGEADPNTGERSGGVAGADATYRQTLASLAQSATGSVWSAIRGAVTAWKTNAATPSTWGGYVDSIYGIAETEDLADAAAYRTAVEAEATAQLAADNASVAAYCSYLRSEATAICNRDQSAATSAETLQLAATTAIATAASEKATATLEKKTEQLDAALALRLESIERMRADGLTMGARLASRDRSLVGVTDYDLRSQITSAAQSDLEALWKANTQERAAIEVALCDALVASTAALEKATLAADHTRESTLWNALGQYWKDEIARETTLAIAEETAVNTAQTALNTAEQNLVTAQITAESSYDQALTNSAITAASSEFTLAQNLWTSQYSTYFSALSSACQNLSDQLVGSYYQSLIAAAQLDYSAQWGYDATYFNAALTKETTYANTTRTLDTNYANSVVGSVFNYCNSQITSSATSLNRTKTSDQAEIDARIAYYLAYENAEYAQALATITAKEDALTRKIDLMSLWSRYSIDIGWTYNTLQYGGLDTLSWSTSYSSNNWSPSNFTGYVYTAIPAATELDALSYDGLNGSSTSSMGNIGLGSSYSLLWQGYNANNLWSGFSNLNSAIKDMTIKNAELTAESSKASARSAYASAYGTLYDAEATAQLGDAQSALTREINAEKTLNTAVWNASETAHTGTLNAIVASDTTSDAATYINASLGSALSYASSVASAFGDFQIGNRQRRYNNASANDPRKSLYSQDVAWATNMKSLRNQTYDVAGDAISDYYASVTSAYTSYASGVLTTLSTAEQAYFSALKTYSIAALNADGDYSLALFEAERDRAEAYIDAAIAELTANYAAEASLAASRASAYAAQLAAVEALFSATQFAEGRGEYDALLQGTSSDQTDYFDEIVSTSSQVVSTQTSANSADATLATQNASALASAQASNAAAYTVATEQADADYSTAVNSAWNDAYLDQLSVSSDFKDAYDLINSTLEAGLENLENAYRAAAFAAYDAFDEEWGEITRVLSYQQTRIDSGLTVGSNVFENPTFDFEVCFVAGTPVLMADGTTKPIEEIRPGDMVLAADHLDPEGKPQAARVARFFNNGEKEVVRLEFGNGEELVCTPSHRFYVCGKGWICAEKLSESDKCLTVEGDRVAFVSREAIEEKRRVYNIEVEGTHTYFVGDDDGVLAHNVCTIPEPSVCSDPHCPRCHGTGKWSKTYYYYNESLGCFRKVVRSFDCLSIHITTSANAENRRNNWEKMNDLSANEYIYSLDYIRNPNGWYQTEVNGVTKFDRVVDDLYINLTSKLSIADKLNFIARANNNRNEEFLSLDLNPLAMWELKDEADSGVMVIGNFLGENWLLLSSSESKFHSKYVFLNPVSGKDCFKWCSESGRELVITFNKKGTPVLDFHPSRIGTFNFDKYPFSGSTAEHTRKDVCPWFTHGCFSVNSNFFSREKLIRM